MSLTVTADKLSQALDLAQQRGLMPTRLSTAEIREQVAAGILRNAVFSARTGNAYYVQVMKNNIARLLQGGRDNDWAQIRLELKQMLQRLGYTPERGFPGDEALGVPPAEPGSLRDLSSDIRINLILKTQEELMRNAALNARGMDGTRLRQFPAWELVRLGDRKVPRDWPQRWVEAGGELVIDSEGRERMMALKTDPIWTALGDSTRFKDALDVAHPPYAFGSGMGWREIHWRDAAAVMGDEIIADARSGRRSADAEKGEEKTPGDIIPAPKAGKSQYDEATLASIRAALKASYEKYGDLSTDKILEEGS
jgi:hypothetical protein